MLMTGVSIFLVVVIYALHRKNKKLKIKSAQYNQALRSMVVSLHVTNPTLAAMELHDLIDVGVLEEQEVRLLSRNLV